MDILIHEKYLEAYDFLKANRDIIEWKDFARGRKDFPEYARLPALFERGSTDAKMWQDYFSIIFGCKATYPFILRVINSFIIAAT